MDTVSLTSANAPSHKHTEDGLWISADVTSFRSGKEKITNRPIIYKWWFKEEILPQLLKQLIHEVDMNRIEYKNGYGLLYIGRGKKGHARLINYHILDSSNFHEKGVDNGRLSSLRQTLCGLLGCKMRTGCETVNVFVDKNCKVEWSIVGDSAALLENESAEIKSHYLPLITNRLRVP
jgi:hypothetical protein